MSDRHQFHRTTPSLEFMDENGVKRPVNDLDYHNTTFPQTSIKSNHGSSDGGSSKSSIHTVLDLGFHAAPLPFSKGRCKCKPASKDIGPHLYESHMSARELKQHFSPPLHPTNDTAKVVDLIRWNIEANLLISEWDSQSSYLPIDAFETLFCMETIKSLMTEHGLRDRIGQIHNFTSTDTYPSRRRILGILTMMNKVDYVEKFIKCDFWDQHFFNANGTDTGHLNPFAGWDRNDRILFNVYQQYFFVPFFDFSSETLSSYNFPKETVMPWDECKRISSGGSGIIRRIRLQPSHHNYLRPLDSMNDSGAGPSFDSANRDHPQGPEAPQYFSLKEIFSGNRETYKVELSALQRTFGQRHGGDHLTKLLLTFQHGDRFFLVFEWADGNLQEFWDSEPQGQDVNNDWWAYEQCLGIATALKKIHGMSTTQIKNRNSLLGDAVEEQRDFGRHGDIKSTNILWFRDYDDKHNHMVLSDLGLTRYHSDITKSQVRYIELDGLTRQYGPPEMDLGMCISQRYDIWSLGCVFLEFCIWYLEGPDGQDQFEKSVEDESKRTPTLATNYLEHTYFNIVEGDNGQKRATVKHAVTDTVSRLRNLPNCTPFAEQMLDLIEKHMLQADDKKRLPIDMLCRELFDFRKSLPKPGDAEHTARELVRHTRGAWSGTSLSRSLSLITGEPPGEAVKPAQETLDAINQVDTVISPPETGTSQHRTFLSGRAETGRVATASQLPHTQGTQSARSRRRGRRHQPGFHDRHAQDRT